MRVFEVFLNDSRLCVAGIDDHCVLTAIVNHVKSNVANEMDLSVGGLVSNTGEHVEWTQVGLNVGDEVRVKILEAASADEPKARRHRELQEELEAQQNYVREMAKRFGWTLTERPI